MRMHSQVHCLECGEVIERKVPPRPSWQPPFFGDNSYLDYSGHKCKEFDDRDIERDLDEMIKQIDTFEEDSKKTVLKTCSGCGINPIGYLMDSKCPKCREITSLQSKDEPQWFKTSSPLPDGPYWWRKDQKSKPELRMVIHGQAWQIGLEWEVGEWSGEWLRIVWPG